MNTRTGPAPGADHPDNGDPSRLPPPYTTTSAQAVTTSAGVLYIPDALPAPTNLGTATDTLYLELRTAMMAPL